MIVLFTDFGWNGPYVGQLHLKLDLQAPNKKIINLLNDAPKFSIKASAHLLSSLISEFPKHTVFLCVVDPGVGTDDRKPVVLFADDRWYVGPGNGLLDVVAARASSTKWFEITWMPDDLSSTFHGRDLFAPMAAYVANKCNVDTVCKPLHYEITEKAGDDLLEIIYIDGFGNAMTGIRRGSIDPGKKLKIQKQSITQCNTFGEIEPGKSFWFVNSNGLVEIAVNQGRADTNLDLEVGTQVSII